MTHGIDVVSAPEASPGKQGVYIFAINHLPNPAVYGEYPYGPAKLDTWELPRAASQIEIFHHVVGSSRATHLRSVKHDLIRTPNDIQIIHGSDKKGEKPLRFFVTNDHRYQHGRWREIEDIYPGATWTDTVHVQLESLDSAPDAASGVHASIALTDMWNNNGLGLAKTTGELLLTSAMGATLYVAKPETGSGAAPRINITDTVEFDSVVDNPSFFHDAADPGSSGVVLAGVGDVLSIPRHAKNADSGMNPARVWFAQPRFDAGLGRRVWERTLLFEDDGARVRTASTAVLVTVGPSLERGERAKGGRRQGWLYVTGFWAENMIAVKADIPNPAGDPGLFGLTRQEN